MYRYTQAQQPRTPEGILLDAQRECNRRDWEREQKERRTRALRGALRLAARHPNPSFHLRFAAEGGPTQKLRAQRQLLSVGVTLEQVEWPDAPSHSQAA